MAEDPLAVAAGDLRPCAGGPHRFARACSTAGSSGPTGSSRHRTGPTRWAIH